MQKIGRSTNDNFKTVRITGALEYQCKKSEVEQTIILEPVKFQNFRKCNRANTFFFHILSAFAVITFSMIDILFKRDSSLTQELS